MDEPDGVEIVLAFVCGKRPWIVNGDKRIPIEAYRDNLELTSGSATAAFLPENLSDHVVPSTS